MKSIVSINDLSKSDILWLCKRAGEIDQQGFPNTLKDKIICPLFLEPSTRTKMSFESAALRSGAKILDFPLDSSSLQKGESFEDTIRMISSYSDAIILRHSENGASLKASKVSAVPIINAGDGKNEHPTQTLLDLYTIIKDRGNLDTLTITIAGDLKYGRTTHSLVTALKHFDINIILASPKILSLPDEFKKIIRDKIILETDDLSEALQSDYCYMTRVQKERFTEDHNFNEEQWILNNHVLQKHASSHIKILHPLPRVNEIHPELDSTPHALYFDQAKNGVPMRVAILEYSLGVLHGSV